MADQATTTDTKTTTPADTDKKATEAKVKKAVKDALKPTKSAVKLKPKPLNIVSVAAGSTLGLVGAYTIARPRYYRMGMQASKDELTNLDVKAAAELAEDQKMNTRLDAAITNL